MTKPIYHKGQRVRRIKLSRALRRGGKAASARRRMGAAIEAWHEAAALARVGAA
jgi:hypothetical protein